MSGDMSKMMSSSSKMMSSSSSMMSSSSSSSTTQMGSTMLGGGMQMPQMPSLGNMGGIGSLDIEELSTAGKCSKYIYFSIIITRNVDDSFIIYISNDIIIRFK